MEKEVDYEINQRTYEWSVRIFSTIKRLLSVNIKLHHEKECLEEGQIFLFNHFARFETFIPQYLIFQESGALCRSVASHEFFEDEAMASYLRRVGAVPNNHPQLLYLLAKEILRGRKVVIFPEGGMVKDRRVINQRGHYSIYSRTALERRKHHTGAAVLGLVLDAFKSGILSAHLEGDSRRIENWAKMLEMEDTDALLMAALKPTLIIPSNITFYPIRVSDNLLSKGADIISEGMSRRRTEELLIEGNILLKDTDMDIRLGEPVRPTDHWNWWERRLFRHLIQRSDILQQLFDLRHKAQRWDERLFALAVHRKMQRVRNQYMERMYAAVTINLSHLAATLIMTLLDRNQIQVKKSFFFMSLYLAIKQVQKVPDVHLHRSLRNPACYRETFQGTAAGLLQFLKTASETDLIKEEDKQFIFLPKLCEDHDFDEVRLENPVMVYANEAEPVAAIRRSIESALKMAETVSAETQAQCYFDDEVRDFSWNRDYFNKPRHREINKQESATETGEPFLLIPEKQRKELAVVLAHGFLASPSEMRPLGERLLKQGYPVVGVRLAGHGTSPWDLKERSWEDWLATVRRGYNVATAYAKHVVLVGFSSGGALSLLFASENPRCLAGVSATCIPLKFRNKNLIFVPLVHGANTLVRWTTRTEGLIPFRPNEPENPHINYRNIPIEGLHQLQRMVGQMERQLENITCPVQLLQADNDHVVDPKSGELILQKLSSTQKSLTLIDSERHGILYEDIDNTQERILEYVNELAQKITTQNTGHPTASTGPHT